MSETLQAERQGFVLTRQWRDTREGIELEYWLATDDGPVRLLVTGQQAVFFIAAAQQAAVAEALRPFAGWFYKPLAMQDFSLSPVGAFYFQSQRELRKARDHLLAQGFDPLEADINPQDRYLMERFARGSLSFRAGDNQSSRQQGKVVSVINPRITKSDYQPALKVLSVDIETAMQGLSLYSIAVYANVEGVAFSKVFMVSSRPVSGEVEVFDNEKALLVRFMDWLYDYDPDVLIGWNVINFDLWFIQRLCKKLSLPFRCGRGVRQSMPAHWRSLDDDGERRAVTIPGRVVLDGIELLKAAMHRFESYALNYVAGSLLGEGKLIQGSDRGQQIADLFRSDKQQLAEYNIQDCKLVWDIFSHAGLLPFAIARSQITGLALDRVGGSVASFDFRYLPLLHRRGFVAPNGHLSSQVESSPGGFVMHSQPGLYDNVAVLDFKSLYPSIIRSFKIDPMGMAIGLHKNLDQSELVPGFDGGWFAKQHSLLPALITELWQARDQAKNQRDTALSQAIKIIMNSFYGVLGSGGCRFFDVRLARSITRRGHQIIQQTAAFIEQQGWPVIYGDTDSVFVWFKQVDSHQQAAQLATKLERQLNGWWQKKLADEYAIDSALEIEFETLYRRFLMPTVRGSEVGSKKRYAGIVCRDAEEQLVFKGLESVRSDWTKLARDFQRELYRRIFYREPYHDYLQQLVAEVLRGEHDNALVYRKRLRRKLEDYQRNIPPHVQAAQKAAAAGMTIRRGDWIEYLITVNGAEPLNTRSSIINYQHYIDRQLAPVADSILNFFDETLAQLVDQQLGLFG